MTIYTAPVADISFLLRRVFGFDAIMASLPGYEEVNTELAVTIMEEAGKFATSVLEPLNRPGDEEGCTLENGVVTTPSGVAARSEEHTSVLQYTMRHSNSVVSLQK